MISGRFNSPIKQNNCIALAKALKALQLPVYVVEETGGGDFGPQTIIGLDTMAVMIMMVTEDYGAKTGSPYSSYFEVKYLIDKQDAENIEFLPLKMYKGGKWPPEVQDEAELRKGKESPGAANLKFLISSSKVFVDCSDFIYGTEKFRADAMAKNLEPDLRKLLKTSCYTVRIGEVAGA